jgi:hypothetical protein
MKYKKSTSTISKIIWLGLISIGANCAFAATYEKQDQDYGQKSIWLMKFIIEKKKDTQGGTYQEGYILYKESIAGRDHKARCLAKICGEFLKNPTRFKEYEEKRASVKTEDDESGSEDSGEIIWDIKGPFVKYKY